MIFTVEELVPKKGTMLNIVVVLTKLTCVRKSDNHQLDTQYGRHGVS